MSKNDPVKIECSSIANVVLLQRKYTEKYVRE